MYKGKETILKANSFFNSKTLDVSMQEGHIINTKPYWIDKVSVFENTPINHVISDISIQYDIKFIMNDNLNKDLKYTGSYHYDDSLETVLDVFLSIIRLKVYQKR